MGCVWDWNPATTILSDSVIAGHLDIDCTSFHKAHLWDPLETQGPILFFSLYPPAHGLHCKHWWTNFIVKKPLKHLPPMQTGNLNRLPLHFFLKSGLNTRNHTLKSFLTPIIYPSIKDGSTLLHMVINPFKMTALSMGNSELQEDIS